MQAQTALKYEVEIEEDGKLSLQIPFARGEQVIVFVVKDTETDLFVNTDETLHEALTYVLEKNADLYRRLA